VKLELDTPKVFKPFLSPSRYKGAHGGRGSGKSHFFAELMLERCLLNPGTRAVCIREVQKTLKDSSKRLLEDKIQSMGIGPYFHVQHDSIKTPGNGIITFVGMQDSNAESIKSLEGFDIAWVEEAQTLSSRSLELLRPTIRKPGSELWFSWNPKSKRDAVDQLLRSEQTPTDATVIEVNYKHNPFFPSILEQERIDCLRLQPDQYDHIWEGDYISLFSGAYFSKSLLESRQNRRIGRVSADPLLPLSAFCDIGGTGATSDAFSMWIAQVVGKEVRVLDYYESRGQPLASHIAWLRSKDYFPHIYLPHDGVTQDKVYAVSYASALQEAGYTTTTVRNQGRGAAMARIECARRQFPSMWFNEDTTKAGLEALAWYHPKIDEIRGVDLGPDHDWSSHAADAFGLLCLVNEKKLNESDWGKPLDYSNNDKGNLWH
jgi:phage terminase large subunit